ncbi:MAG: hypothetical protein GX633_04410, partial [Clostridiales bacterium]|nr:hypothetical protein [Clostridiales bacterium]
MYMYDSFEYSRFLNPDMECYPVYSWVWNEVLSKGKIAASLDEIRSRNIYSIYIIPLPKEFRPHTMVTNLEPEYLSEGYFEMFKYAVDYAYDLGIRLWLYDEAGWPSGSANFLVVKDETLRLKILDNGEIKETGLPDLTNIKATKKFIKLTHEAYRKGLGDSFHKLAPFCFTDEPDIRACPFTESIREEYKRIYGEEINTATLSDFSDPEQNIRYHDLCARLFADNYFIPIRDWCRENGIMSTGHLNGEDAAIYTVRYGYHHPMRLLRLFDVPGVDVIWRQIYPGKETFFFPRYASSASNQTGNGLSVSESISVYGNVSYDIMRYITGFQLVRGINIFNYMLIMYDESGYYSIRQRPSFSPLLPGSDCFPDYNTYIARLSYIGRLGRADTRCALYMPVRDIWARCKGAAESFEEMGRDIERHHGQFDIIDDDYILDGNILYDVIYIPSEEYMPNEVREKLKAFACSGAEVIRRSNMKYYPSVVISGDNGNIRAMKRVCGSDTILVLFNEGDNVISCSAGLHEYSYRLDLMDGKAYNVDSDLRFESGEMKIFVKTVNPISACRQYSKNTLLFFFDSFEFRPVSRFVLSEKGSERLCLEDKPVTVSLGDWKKYIGEDFSGECEYISSFSLPDENAAYILSLGTVNYCCKVYVNGTPVAVSLFPPHNITLKGDYLKKNNELRIVVANTAANAFVYFTLP